MRKLLWTLYAAFGALALAQQISPQGIIVNPVPTDLKVKVWVDKDPAKRGQAVYQVGEPIFIYVNVNQDAYVYLFNINADGRIDPILPNAYERDNFLRAGETRRFPPEGARYRYTVTGPEGQDRILAVASKRPLSLQQILDVERGRVLVQGAEGLARALSIVVEPLPAKDWVTDVAFYFVGRVPPSTPGRATLEVDSSPRGAEVLLDGRSVGRTPVTLETTPGRHEVEVRLSGYQTFKTTVNPRPGERVRLFAQLVPEARTGFLYVNSTPQGAEVYVSGELRGRTPLSLSLPEGSYAVELRLADHEPYRATVRVERGRESRLEVRLTPIPKTGTLSLDSLPQGAEVYVNGALVGRTPLSLSLAEGRHEVRLALPGYGEYRAQVEVRRNETTRLFVQLVPVRAVVELYLNAEARVFLDGEEVGLAKGGYLRFEAPFGRHELTLVAPGYRTLVQTLDLYGNQTLRFTLSPL
ncbi:PEGA domain-containing protein [Thermus filiformis]|uniref:S-layer protein n=1 Tax=Thermus filiformis TaxID=276 RepID=A0A0A2WPP0_THEFI|nr:PEGA domain-containing protein [Thermus filiformis]KGQ21788.1 S-layer protein [Thermus filiformis]